MSKPHIRLWKKDRKFEMHDRDMQYLPYSWYGHKNDGKGFSMITESELTSIIFFPIFVVKKEQKSEN